MFASAPQRQQHDFKTERWGFSASNSIWPIVCVCIPRPNPSPASPDAAADARRRRRKRAAARRAPLRARRNLLALLPAPPRGRTLPARCRALQALSPQVYLPRPSGLFQGPLHCFPAGAGGDPARGRGPLGPAGRGRAPRGGPRGPQPRPGKRPPASADPFIAPSAVNLSALPEAFTSFFICSSF